MSDTYVVEMFCTNCGARPAMEFPKCTPVPHDKVCPTCGCLGLVRGLGGMGPHELLRARGLAAFRRESDHPAPGPWRRHYPMTWCYCHPVPWGGHE